MKRPRLTIVVVIVAIFIWTMFAPTQHLQQLKMKVIACVRTPLIIVDNFINYFLKICRLAYTDSEKLELKKSITELEKKLAELEELRLENDRLRDLLGLRELLGKLSVPAAVIGRDPNSWSSVIFINKGTKDGVVKDMVVVSRSGLAGRVREAGKTISSVMLINDIDSKVGALVQRNREQGLLVGTPGGECKLIYLSIDSDIEVGDKVLTSGIGGIYPKGIFIGGVKEVAREKGRLYKYAIIEPSSRLSNLEEILCIK